jgi:hypothetical protein
MDHGITGNWYPNSRGLGSHHAPESLEEIQQNLDRPQ